MVKGLDRFRQHFRGAENAFVIIGGAACDAWFSARGTQFRLTRDLDIVLIVEAVDAAFVARLWGFVKAGRYQKRERTNGGKPISYRFQQPAEPDYPSMLELFSRPAKQGLLDADQSLTQIPAGEDASSLSAIILDEDYYRLIMERREVRDGLPMAGPSCLIPLKVRAWLDLTRRVAAGERIDSEDIRKHRNDIFRLALYLPAASTHEPVRSAVREDMLRFVSTFAPAHPEWQGVMASLRTTDGPAIPTPSDLLDTLVSFFGLTP